MLEENLWKYKDAERVFLKKKLPILISARESNWRMEVASSNPKNIFISLKTVNILFSKINLKYFCLHSTSVFWKYEKWKTYSGEKIGFILWLVKKRELSCISRSINISILRLSAVIFFPLFFHLNISRHIYHIFIQSFSSKLH